MKLGRTVLPRRHTWELARFCVVGASGYVVNLVVFKAVYGQGIGHLAAATLAFLVAVTSNFVLNREWTFASAAARARRVQAPRFLAVSVATFGVTLGLLEILVSLGQVPALAAQACSILVATPLNFAGQKLWSFRPARSLNPA